MKKYPFVSKIATITGLALGAFALSALATGTWTAPSAPAPGGNVDAPINVGGTPQYKTGALGIGAGTIAPASKALLQVFGAGIIETLGVTNLYVVSGEQTAGNVLTLDGGGKAVWAKPTGGSVASPAGSQVFNSTGTWTVPAGVTVATFEVWGGGGGGASNHGGGGGGGGYSKVANVSVTPNTTYTVNVGGGGNYGFPTTNCPVYHLATLGSSGGASSVVLSSTVMVSAGGGGGGNSSCSDTIDPGLGGTGGVGSSVAGASGTSVSWSDCDKHLNQIYIGGGTAGNGGAGAPGGCSPTSNILTDPGILPLPGAPGGGGAGKYSSYMNGSSGAGGRAEISW